MKQRIITVLFMVLMLLVIIPENCLVYAETSNGGEKKVITIGTLQIDEETEYSFQNAYATEQEAGLFLNIQHAGTTNGTKVTLWALDMSEPNTQRYRFTIVDEEKRIVRVSPVRSLDKYLDVRRNNKDFAEGQGIVIWEADGDPLKELYLEFQEDGSFYFLFSTETEYCIAPESKTAAHARQKQLTVCKKDSALEEQRWYLCNKDGERINFTVSSDFDLKFKELEQLKDLAESLEKKYKNSLNYMNRNFGKTYPRHAIQYANSTYQFLETLYQYVYRKRLDEALWMQCKENYAALLNESMDGAIAGLEEYKAIAGKSLGEEIDKLISAYKGCMDFEKMADAVIDLANCRCCSLDDSKKEYQNIQYEAVNDIVHKKVYTWKNPYLQEFYGSAIEEENHDMDFCNQCKACKAEVPFKEAGSYMTVRKIPIYSDTDMACEIGYLESGTVVKVTWVGQSGSEYVGLLSDGRGHILMRGLRTWNMREAIAEVALNEYTQNYHLNPFSKSNKYTYYRSHEWCAAFTSWCAREANIPTEIIPQIVTDEESKSMEGYKYGNGYSYKGYSLLSVPQLVNYYKKEIGSHTVHERVNGVFEYTPQVGDFVVYDWPEISGPYNHIGLVVAVNIYTDAFGRLVKEVKTVEGNTIHNTTKAKSCLESKVRKYDNKYSWGHISAFISPEY